MKPIPVPAPAHLRPSLFPRLCLSAAALACSALFLAGPAKGADNTWNNAAGGSWTDGGNWTATPQWPGDPDRAFLNALGLTGNITITNAGGTLGELYLGTTSGTGAYTLNGTELTFANGDTTNSRIEVLATSQGDTIASNIFLSSDDWDGANGVLAIVNHSQNALTLSGVISEDNINGPGKINLKAGGLVLTNSANSFSGGINVEGGTLTLRTNYATNAAVNLTAGGTGKITLGSASSEAVDAALVLETLTFGTSSGKNIATPTFTFAQDITVLAGNSGKATIAMLGNYAYDRNRPKLMSITGNIALGKDTIFANGERGLWIDGLVSGAGGVEIQTNGGIKSSTGKVVSLPVGSVIFSNANTYTGATVIRSGELDLIVAANNTNVTNYLGTNTGALVMGDTNGILGAKLLFGGAFTGTVLDKAIKVEAGSAGYAFLAGYAQGDRGRITGNIELNKSLLLGYGVTLSGNITKGADAIGGVSLITNGQHLGGAVQEWTGNNTYDGGTIINSGVSLNNKTGQLGTGNVVIEGHFLRLIGGKSIANDKTFLVKDGGALWINYDGVNAAGVAALLDSQSSGAFLTSQNALVGNNTQLDLSLFGNGNMWYGGGTFSGSSILANQDGSFRLGYGNVNSISSVTVANENVLTGTGKVIVGDTTGFMNPIPGSIGTNRRVTAGNLILSKNNDYSGGTEVNYGSSLTGVASTMEGKSPWGSGGVTLHNAVLQLNGVNSVDTNTALSALNVRSSNFLQLQAGTSSTNTLTIGAINREDKSVLYITGVNETHVLGNTIRVKVSDTTSLTTEKINNGADTILGPWFLDPMRTNGKYISTNGYLTYDNAKGFVAATAGKTYTSGTWDIDGLTTDYYVKATSGNTVLTKNTTVYALSLGDGTAGRNLTSNNSAPLTLTITGGMLDLSAFFNGYIGSKQQNPTANGVININFGTATGYINTGLHGGDGPTIYNKISGSGGVVVSGSLRLNLYGDSDFTGGLTINSSIVTVGYYGDNGTQIGDRSLGALGESITLNGGGLQNFSDNCNYTLHESRDLIIGEMGGTLLTGAGPVNMSSCGITVNSRITGTGVYLNLNSTANETNPGESSERLSTFVLTNTNNTFTSTVNINGRVKLQVENGLGVLGTGSNAISLNGGYAYLLYNGASGSTTRSLSFLDMGGVIDIAKAGTEAVFTGTIDGSGMMTKAGLGKLVLTGSSSATGNIAIGEGVLNIRNSDALGVASGVVTGSTGVSGGATFVETGAALELEGNLVVGDKTLYLDGSGIGGNGALRNVSGSSSMAGAVVLQTDTVIGVDAGSLTLSGSLMGTRNGASSALAKVGAGKLETSGNGDVRLLSVEAGTLANSGTLNVTSGSATVASLATLTNDGLLASNVEVADGGTFNGIGTVDGDVTVNDGGVIGVGVSAAGTSHITGDLTVLAGAKLTLNLTEAAQDKIIVDGNFTMEANSILDIHFALDANEGDTFVLVDNLSYDLLYNTSVYFNDQLVSLDATGLFTVGANEWQLMLAYDENGVIKDQALALTAITVTPVPEPQTWAMLAGGLGTLILAARRRMRARA